MPSLNTGNAILSNPIKVETTAYNVGIGGAASSSFKLQVTGTTNLTGALTGTTGTFSGNVAIGTTSSAWSGFTALDISNVGSLAVFPSFGVSLFRNAYYDGSVYRYKITSAASYYEQTDIGGHEWYTAASGTAGNTITWGTAKFKIASTGTATFQTTGNNGIINIGGSSFYSQLQTDAVLGGLKIKSIWGATNSGIIQFINGTAENVRMHIADNGNIGIGTTTISSAAKLQIVGGLLAVEPSNGNTDIQILLGRGLSSLGTSAGIGVTSKINFAFEGSNDNFYQEIGFVTTTANQTRVNSAADFYISTKAAGASSPTEKFRITSGGLTTFSIPRTSGTNVNSITLSDNVTGVQTSGFGVRILATSNNGSARSALAFEQDGGTNNDTAIAFYTQFSAASLDRRMTINRNGNVLVGSSTADYGYKLAVASGTQHLGAGFVVSNDITSTGRQAASGIADFGGTSVTFDLASIFPRLTFTNRGLSVTMQLVAIPTYTIVSSGFVVLGRTGNSNVWSNNILVNININGAGINSVSASGTVITVNYSTSISGTAYINVVTIG